MNFLILYLFITPLDWLWTYLLEPIVDFLEPQMEWVAGIARREPFLTALFCIAAPLLALHWRSVQPNMVLFSNDGPLGAIMAQHRQDAFSDRATGTWNDLNWIGFAGPGISPTISNALNATNWMDALPFLWFVVLLIAYWKETPRQNAEYEERLRLQNSWDPTAWHGFAVMGGILVGGWLAIYVGGNIAMKLL